MIQLGVAVSEGDMVCAMQPEPEDWILCILRDVTFYIMDEINDIVDIGRDVCEKEKSISDST